MDALQRVARMDPSAEDSEDAKENHAQTMVLDKTVNIDVPFETMLTTPRKTTGEPWS